MRSNTESLAMLMLAFCMRTRAFQFYFSQHEVLHLANVFLSPFNSHSQDRIKIAVTVLKPPQLYVFSSLDYIDD